MLNVSAGPFKLCIFFPRVYSVVKIKLKEESRSEKMFQRYLYKIKREIIIRTANRNFN